MLRGSADVKALNIQRHWDIKVHVALNIPRHWDVKLNELPILFSHFWNGGAGQAPPMKKKQKNVLAVHSA